MSLHESHLLCFVRKLEHEEGAKAVACITTRSVLSLIPSYVSVVFVLVIVSNFVALALQTLVLLASEAAPCLATSSSFANP
jgi:hypothetical protein